MKPDLPQLLARWQRDLRLLDWRIEIAYVRDLTLPNGVPVHGLCCPFVDGKRAKIAIRDPETPATSRDPSVEETLIHELLHLHFAPLSGEGSAAIAAEEQAVWAITEAMVKGSGRQTAMIARAMAAHAKSSAPARRMGGAMDPKLIAAALDALIAGDTNKCAEILKGIVTAAATGGESAPPSEPPAGEGEMPQAPPAMGADCAPGGGEDPKRPPAQAAAPAPSATRAQAAPAGSPAGVTREEFDKFRVEQLLTASGGHLTATQRAFAAGLDYERAKAYLATHAPAPPPPERGKTPVKGGEGTVRASRLAPEARAQLDAQMGLATRTQAVRREGRVMFFGVAAPGGEARNSAGKAGA